MDHKHVIGNAYGKHGGSELIYIAKVVSVDDKFDGGRIRVRIQGIDNPNTKNNELPYCFPLLPKFLNIMPKVGESVLIFSFNTSNPYERRMWLGPIISQPQKLSRDPHLISSHSLFDIGVVAPDQAPSTLPDARGVYPTLEDIAIQGRNNTDIILKDNEIQIRSGKFELNKNLKFNKKDPAYIQLKKRETESVINVVASRINLVAHKGSYKQSGERPVLVDQDSMITDKDIDKLNQLCYSLVYGEKLVEFCNLVKQFVATHVHPYHGLPPTQTVEVQKVLNFNLDSMLSKYVKTN